jgi:hypothetical protein
MPMSTQSEASRDALPASLLARASIDRPPDLENDRFPDEQSFVDKRASIPLVRFLIILCIGVGATLAWQSYGAREMIASSDSQLSGLARQADPVAQNAPDVIGLSSRTASSPEKQQPNTTLLDLDAVRQSIDRIATSIASSQGRMTSSADRMATTQEQIGLSIERMATTQEQIARSVDRIATSQEQITRSVDQIAPSIAARQEQMTRGTDQTAISVDEVPTTEASNVTVERRDRAVSLQPAARLTERPPQTLAEKEKPLSAASAHDPSCFPSASAVLQNYPGSSPSWTLRAPGHEGTKCWRAATRTKESDQTRASTIEGR